MRFGRVIGVVSVPVDDSIDRQQAGRLKLRVTLEDGQRVETVRSEVVPIRPVPSDCDPLSWQADQYTQETIGNELALAGWEPIGVAPDSEAPVGTLRFASSPTYIVRKV